MTTPVGNNGDMENTQITKFVTCKDVAIGDTIICLNYIPIPDENRVEYRDKVPMTVGQIIVWGKGRTKTYRYLTADGEYITYGGGRTLVEKIIEP